jgi:hypothetical protein
MRETYLPNLWLLACSRTLTYAPCTMHTPSSIIPPNIFNGEPQDPDGREVFF